MVKWNILSFVLLSSFWACQSSNKWIVYDEVDIIEPWNQEDTLILNLDPVPQQELMLYLQIRHTEDLRYENVYLRYTIDQQGKNPITEIVSIPMMTDQGEWLGHKHSSEYTLSSAFGVRDFTIPMQIIIEQYSRERQLGGIVAIGVGAKAIQ